MKYINGIKVGNNTKDLTNLKVGKLTVLKPVSRNKQGCVMWLCDCECGTQVTYSSDHLTRKNKPVIACGCYKKIHGPAHKNWKGYGEISHSWWKTHVTRQNNSMTKHKLKVDIDIVYGWDLFLSQDRKCALSGVSLNFNRVLRKNTASLDRIDSSKGYIKGNVQWVHKHINFMKNIYDQEYFIEMCKLVAKTHS